MLAKDNPVKKWSVAPRGLTVCHVIFAWFNNYNIKPYKNKEAKKAVRQLLSPNHLLLDLPLDLPLDLSLNLSLSLLFIEPIYIKKPHKLNATYGVIFCQIVNQISKI